ncbi:MAG: tetratricopeptide repeat protein [Dehalococcoidales bacterium]|nr:tetratricopeptide repeat protein [Dehalococcoidales bacterium]
MYQKAQSLRRLSTQEAVSLAMEGRWKEAVEANKRLLESFPNDIDACNRLGKAYMELGEYYLAREAYEKTLELDQYNTIAKKNLNRLSHLGNAAVGSGSSLPKVEPQQFIEEAGKSGIVNLTKLAPPEILGKTTAGEAINLKIEGSNLIVGNSREEYLGQIEPKEGQRLIKLMEGGNRYEGAIISSTEEAVTVIIREVYQHPSQEGRHSFPPKRAPEIRPFVSDRIIRQQLESEETLPEEVDYTVVGGEEIELLPKELADADEESDNEEEEE